MQIVTDYSNSLVDLIEKIESFTLTINNKTIYINSGKKFDDIKQNLHTLFLNSRLEPAFGVSLHNLTLQAKQSGTWLEIAFETEQIKNGLHFNSLLFCLEETGGINLIRKQNNKYNGRCLYLHLEKITDLISVIS